MKKICYPVLISSLLLSACSAPDNQRKTIRSIDIVSKQQQHSKVFIQPKSTADIRKAYAEYLQHASIEDKSRLDAITRLAEIEFELSSKLQQENENLENGNKQQLDDQLYNARLQKTIDLLNTSLRDYPKAKGNDRILYQLAKAYDHNGDSLLSEKTLQKIIKRYPKSPYYIESLFRLAEIHFSRRQYLKAEDLYTEIIGSPKNNIFYEKALFKRGWARFKQEYYLEAVDDYLRAIEWHQFENTHNLSKSEQGQFDEYFRAVGLSFSYLGGAEPLNEYFQENPGFPYIYHSYAHVSDIYRKQQRYNDAAETLNYFIRNNKNSANVPVSLVKIVEIWKEGGFAKKASEAIEILYKNYHPQHKFWLSKNASSDNYKVVSKALRNNILETASWYHKQYTETKKSKYYTAADKWYNRYLKHYKSTASKDKVLYRYASLLAAAKQHNKALSLYEQAAYDGNIILDKKAAYATILLTDKLYKKLKDKQEKQAMLNRHIKYATLYTQLYANSKKASSITLHAAELAFQTRQFEKTIALAETIANNSKGRNSTKARIIKAHAYFNLKQYGNAEAAYFSVLDGSGKIGKKLHQQLVDKLALSIYKQAEQASQAGNLNDAIENYTRIVSIAPSSSIAATGYYDAIALAMKNKLWNVSIRHITQFQKIFPRSKYQQDITKKLSVAYLKSNQGIKAAKEFEKISGFEQNQEVKIAALWQAAELYEEKGDMQQAIRSYENYAKKYKKPFPQYMEAMNKLTGLYAKAGNHRKIAYWNRQIIKADKKTIDKYKTERTRYITSIALINQAKAAHQQFSQQKLVLPLNKSLRKKKKAMQTAVRYYGLASKYGIAGTATEATHAIAEIYKAFSKDLLNSEKPKGLTADQLEQYTILLEDKAFPFEDKAIEFYEANMAHIKDGVYDIWVKQSHSQLKQLFPARYKRSMKIDGVIHELH